MLKKFVKGNISLTTNLPRVCVCVCVCVCLSVLATFCQVPLHFILDMNIMNTVTWNAGIKLWLVNKSTFSIELYHRRHILLVFIIPVHQSVLQWNRNPSISTENVGKMKEMRALWSPKSSEAHQSLCFRWACTGSNWSRGNKWRLQWSAATQ